MSHTDQKTGAMQAFNHQQYDYENVLKFKFNMRCSNQVQNPGDNLDI